MKIKLGTNIINKDIIDIDIDNLKESGQCTNIIMNGMSGSGKTNLVKNIVKQFSITDNSEVLILYSAFCEYFKEFDDTSNIHLYSVDAMFNCPSDSAIDELIAQLKQKLESCINKNNNILLVFENAQILCGTSDKIKDFIVQIIRSARMLNCSVITTWNNIIDIEKEIVINSNIACLFKVTKHDEYFLNRTPIFNLSDRYKGEYCRFRIGQFLLMHNNNTVPVISERYNNEHYEK